MESTTMPATATTVADAERAVLVVARQAAAARRERDVQRRIVIVAPDNEGARTILEIVETSLANADLDIRSACERLLQADAAAERDDVATIAHFLDAATAERYRIARFGNNGFEVEWFGRTIVFNRHPALEPNWHDAVTWCEQVRARLAAMEGESQ